jgi:NADH-quinone oxidoreductase subunit J
MDAAQPILFYLVAGITAFCAVATVVTQNIVRSATWLLFTLSGTAGVFFLLSADLVGAVQILVYVGGTLVLVVFGVMLTAQGPFINMKASSAEWAISAAVGVLLLGVLVVSVTSDKTLKSLVSTPLAKGEDKVATAPYSAVIGQGFLGVGVGPVHMEGGQKIRMNYLLPFELVSVHLLVVLIGAAYLARAKRRAHRKPMGEVAHG